MTVSQDRIERLRTISLIDAGALLGIARSSSFKRAKDGTFPVPVRVIAGKQRVRVSDIEAYLDDGSQTPSIASNE